MRLRIIHLHRGGVGGWGGKGICLSYCSELYLKVGCSVEDRPRSVSNVTTAGKLKSSSLEERKSPKFRVGLPLIWARRQFPEIGAKSMLRSASSPQFCRLGGWGWGLGARRGAATTISLHTEQQWSWGDLSPGDLDGVLSLLLGGQPLGKIL